MGPIIGPCGCGTLCWHAPNHTRLTMRIPDWTPELKPQPQDLVDAIVARRGGALLNLDRALLWSEPLARGWNFYLKNVRTGLSASRKLRELGICTVALLTGADYEYRHHAPDYLQAGGSQAELDALRSFAANPRGSLPAQALGADEALVMRYAAQMTLDVKVDDALFAQLRERFDTTALVELTAAIATYNMVARLLVALNVTAED
jgi:alkylhydroperoxidase family enzyme